MAVVFAISFSAVIFSGPLAPLLSKGIGIGLFSATAVATLAPSCAAAGLVLLGLGYFKLGVLVRYIPYAVVGGFLAATG